MWSHFILTLVLMTAQATPIPYFETEIAADLMWRLRSTFIIDFPADEVDLCKLRGTAFWRKAGQIIKKATPLQTEALEGTIQWIDAHSAWTCSTASVVREHIEKAKALS
jgi:hypothetical protein